MSLFVTLEGIEGCGKSTQAHRLADHLKAQDHEVVLTHEPGGTALTVEIRRLLADPESRLDGRAELLLFLADRAQHVSTVINPALERGAVVVCDRYSDSTMAYQGFGRGHDLDWLVQLNQWSSHGRVPDLTIWIDCDVEVGLQRARHGAGGPGDRFEAEPTAFHLQVRDGFAAMAAEHTDRVVRVDGTQTEEAVASDIIAAVEARLP